jgi:protease YdgD
MGVRFGGPDGDAGLIRVVLAAALLLPGLGTQDQRERVDGTRLPWAAVLRVQIPGVSLCTGFAVAPRLVVTAAHCLFSRRVGRMMPVTTVHVLSSYALGAFARHSVAVSYRLPPDFVPGLEHRPQASDVALLTLAEPVTAAILVPVAAESGQPAMLGGYSQDRAEVILADPDCRVLGTAPDSQGRLMELHSCAATRGTSGAPLLVRLANGAWEAGGVQVDAAESRVGGVAVPASVVQTLLRTR